MIMIISGLFEHCPLEGNLSQVSIRALAAASPIANSTGNLSAPARRCGGRRTAGVTRPGGNRAAAGGACTERTGSEARPRHCRAWAAAARAGAVPRPGGSGGGKVLLSPRPGPRPARAALVPLQCQCQCCSDVAMIHLKSRGRS